MITLLFSWMNVWEGYNMYKQCQLIIEFILSNYNHYSPPSPSLLFALLYLSALSIPWLEANHCPLPFPTLLFALLYLFTFFIPWLEAKMDPVEEEHQARRAEEQAQRDLPNITPASVLNRGRERERERWQSKFYLTSAHVPQNLEDTILDLHRRQLTQQQQRTTQGHREVEVERQRQVEINQIMEN